MGTSSFIKIKFFPFDLIENNTIHTWFKTFKNQFNFFILFKREL